MLRRLFSRAPRTESHLPLGSRRRGGHVDAAPAGQVLAGQRSRVLQQARHRARVHDVAAPLPRARADVDHPVRAADRVLVVLDDEDRVAQLAEVLEGVDEAVVVALVQADGRLVEHVQHADQAAADLAGQADALRLAAGQRGGRAAQRQVVEADVAEERQAGVDLLDHPLGDQQVAVGQLEVGQHLGGLADRHRAQLGDVVAGDGHGQRERLQPGTAAGRARHLPHVAGDLLALGVGVGLLVAALQERHRALVAGRVGPASPVAVAVDDLDPALVADAVEQQVALALGELGPRPFEGDPVVLGHGFDEAGVERGASSGEGGDGALRQRQVGVGHDQLGVDLVAGTEPVAALAGAVGGVEGEVAGGQLLEGLAVGRPGQVLGEDQQLGLGVAGQQLDLGHALGQAQRGLERVGQPPFDAGAQHQPVDDDLDRVDLVAAEVDLAAQLVLLAVDHDPGEALPGEVVEELLVGALAAPHDRCQDLHAAALGQLQHPVDDLLGRLAEEPLAGLGVVGDADPGEQQSQVVVDLGDGPDRRAGVARGGLLVDGDGGRQAVDEVDVGLVHLAEELAGVRRQRLDVAPLALGVDRVERQRRLARAGQPGEDDDAVPRQLEGDVPQVVLPGAPDHELVGHSCPRLSGPARATPGRNRARRAVQAAPRRGPLIPRHGAHASAPSPRRAGGRRTRSAGRRRPGASPPRA